MKRFYGLGLILLGTGAISSCGRDSDAAQAPAAPPRRGYIDGGDSLRIIAHSENLPVGLPSVARPFALTSPYADGDKNAISTGGKLFIAYNCIDCHGADGSGAMGPAFSDGRWHFGGAPGEVFESIYQGRPDGMPAWGGRIDNTEIWMLATYVRSLATKDLSTENFAGTTVERTGH